MIDCVDGQITVIDEPTREDYIREGKVVETAMRLHRVFLSKGCGAPYAHIVRYIRLFGIENDRAATFFS